MTGTQVTFTVYFENPYWVGVFEREQDGMVSACKVVFGAEPKNHELFSLLEQYPFLRFSAPIPADRRETPGRMNPKRMQRLITGQMKETGSGTKAQQALKLQHAANKEASRVSKRMRRDEEEARKFELRQQKKKDKHRGH